MASSTGSSKWNRYTMSSVYVAAAKATTVGTRYYNIMLLNAARYGATTTTTAVTEMSAKRVKACPRCD